MLTQKQIENRRFAVGGSEISMVLGLSKFKTARQLYHEKRGEIVTNWDEEDEVRWWGRMLEPVVRQKYAETTGRVVRLPTDTLFHPEHDFMCANLDGVSELPDGTDPHGYEGKTAFHSTGWGDEDTDQIPEDYLLQTQHYLAVSGLPVFDVTTLIGRKFKYYTVEPDKELHGMIVEASRDFIRRVREGDPPPLDYQHKTTLDVIKKINPGTNGVSLVASEDAIKWRDLMDQASEVEKTAKAQKDGYKARLLDIMGESAQIVFPDGKAYRRKRIDKQPYQVAATSYIDCRFVNAR